MVRAFIVEGKALAVMTDRKNAAVKRHPQGLGWRGPIWRRRFLAIGRPQRIARESREAIGQHQLLMLLLVMDAEFDEAQCPGRLAVCAAIEKRIQRRIDMPAVANYLVMARPGEQAALRPGVARAGGFVVGIEAIAETVIEYAIGGIVGLQHHLFEEPGRVRQVPLRRTGVLHGLHDLIFLGERLRDPERGLPGAAELFAKAGEGAFGWRPRPPEII